MDEYKVKIDEIIGNYIKKCTYNKKIINAIEYVLYGGKRLRSSLTLSIMDTLNSQQSQSLQSPQPQSQSLCNVALVPEFIHTASLVIDDLPAFDNSSIRREQKCIHLKENEGIAYLVSFTLLTDSIMIINDQLPILKTMYPMEEAYKIYEIEMQNLLENMSASRAIDGQLLSTYHLNPNEVLTTEEIYDILVKKTSSFFEISLITGWIFGGGSMSLLPKVKKCAELLGVCYQICDDFQDYNEDTDISHNYVKHVGKDQSHINLCKYKEELRTILVEIGLDNDTMLAYIINVLLIE